MLEEFARRRRRPSWRHTIANECECVCGKTLTHTAHLSAERRTHKRTTWHWKDRASRCMLADRFGWLFPEWSECKEPEPSDSQIEESLHEKPDASRFCWNAWEQISPGLSSVRTCVCVCIFFTYISDDGGELMLIVVIVCIIITITPAHITSHHTSADVFIMQPRKGRNANSAATNLY